MISPPNVDRSLEQLPLNRGLGHVYLLSLFIAALMALVAAAGLLFQSHIYITEEKILSFAPADIVHLFIGLPALLVAMQLARRTKLAGLLCWPGMLLYVIYFYVLYGINLFPSPITLAYAVLVVCSAYALVYLLMSINSTAVQERLIDRVPARLPAVVLILIPSLLIIRQIALIVKALSSPTPISQEELAFWLSDLVIIPFLLAGGIQLWRRKAFGYLISTGLFFLCSIIFIMPIPVMIFQAHYLGTQASLLDIGVVLLAGLFCIVPLIFFLRGTTI